MPLYTFKNKETGEIWDERMSLSDRERKLQDPNIEQLITGAPRLNYSQIGKKPDDNFRDVLKRIKSKHRGSNINTF